MLKNSEVEDDELKLYFSYIKLLLTINQSLICETPDKQIIKNLLEDLDIIHSRLNEKYLERICKRIKYLCVESLNNRSCYFFIYILRSKFKTNFQLNRNMVSTNFDNLLNLDKSQHEFLPNESDTLEITDIIELNLSIRDFKSPIIDHNSMYNANVNYDYTKILSYRGHIFEHFFLWLNDYFHMYLGTIKVLMDEEGFIPKNWRYYIGLMAVSTMKCEYLFKILEEKFLENGGDEFWLVYGLNVVPEKLSKLSRINNLLAHQPWKIVTDDIKELTVKKDQNDNTTWNLGEFMQAALIIIEFQKLALIVDSLNIKLMKNGGCGQGSGSYGGAHAHAHAHTQNSNVKDHLNLLKNLESIIAEEQNESSSSNKIKENTSVNKSWLSENEAHSEIPIDFESLRYEQTVAYDKHVNKHCNLYHDFDPHSDEYRYHLEFNWNDHGFYILQNLFPKGVECFDSEIKFVTTLTTNSLGKCDRQLNTHHIRYSISCYIEKILGYYHEEYDYSNVNKLMTISYKKFIKYIACYPQRLSKEDFQQMSMSFNIEEILHIILLVASVKCRLQLTYLSFSLYEVIKTIE